ncbi:MAG: hypothetical protein MHM6MM_003211 [Cercozoa sp. M6MM]
MVAGEDKPAEPELAQRVQQLHKDEMQFDWCQHGDTNIDVAFYVKEVDENSVVAVVNERGTQLTVAFCTKTGRELQRQFRLSKAVQSEVSVKVNAFKCCVTLTPQVTEKWLSLERRKEQQMPTSNQQKTVKHWEELAKLEEAEERESESVGHFFRRLYQSADCETQRAMQKSYAESHGTVLSTNWDDVKNKDFGGKDRPEATQGFTWRE